MDTLFPLYFSSSVLSDIPCKTKFFRKHCQKLIGSGISVHLQAGGLLAKALEITRSLYFNEKVDAEEAIEAGYEFILAAEEIKSTLKSNENLAFAFKRYFKVFPLSHNRKPCELADGTFAIEYLFELDLGIPHPEIPEKNLLFTGKLDFLGEEKTALGKIERFVEDDKTTSKVRWVAGTNKTVVDIAKEEEQYKTRGQFIGYHFAAHAIGINTSKTIVRRIPLLEEAKPPFELTIPINQFMIDNWYKGTINDISELVERYKFFKKTGKMYEAFPPCYGDSCNSYDTPCEYKIGCILPEGEQLLAMSCRQGVRYPENRGIEEITLSDYKKQFNL